MTHRLRRRALLVAGILAFDLVMGTAGFVIVADYPVFDAFYMAITTITTVGYSEVRPLGRAGRVFNAFYLAFGVTTMFLAIGAVTQTVIELELGNYFGKRRIRRMIEQLNQHYIVCGFGRVGRGAAAELHGTRAPFLVVDRSEERVERALRAGLTALHADCTRDETLREAGIMRARGLVAALASDADNLFLVLSAKTLNPSLFVAARASEDEAEQKLRRAGADVVFAPYSAAGHRLAQSLLRPHVHEFLDFASMGSDVRIEQVYVSPGSELAAKSLGETQLRRDLGVVVLAIRTPEGHMTFNPPADTTIAAGDHLIAMGGPVNLRKLEEMLAGVRG